MQMNSKRKHGATSSGKWDSCDGRGGSLLHNLVRASPYWRKDKPQAPYFCRTAS
jgi:hypothetical protein